MGFASLRQEAQTDQTIGSNSVRRCHVWCPSGKPQLVSARWGWWWCVHSRITRSELGMYDLPSWSGWWVLFIILIERLLLWGIWPLRLMWGVYHKSSYILYQDFVLYNQARSHLSKGKDVGRASQLYTYWIWWTNQSSSKYWRHVTSCFLLDIKLTLDGEGGWCIQSFPISVSTFEFRAHHHIDTVILIYIIFFIFYTHTHTKDHHTITLSKIKTNKNTRTVKMVFIKLCTFFVFVAPLLAFSTIYSDCQGGSLLSMCQETLESGFVSTENDKFHRVSNAHEYYTTGSCKITYWT